MILKRVLTIVVLIFFAIAFIACEQEGPAEKAGEKIDEAVEKTAEKIQEAGEAIKEKAQEAKSELKEAGQ